MQENVCDRVKTAFGFTSDWMKLWREFLIQSCSVVTQNQLLSALSEKAFPIYDNDNDNEFEFVYNAKTIEEYSKALYILYEFNAV